MQAFSTIFLIHTLRATLEAVEDVSHLDWDHPGLIEFKQTLLDQISRLRPRASAIPDGR